MNEERKHSSFLSLERETIKLLFNQMNVNVN